MGRDLLESIDLICTGQKYFPKPVSFKTSFGLKSLEGRTFDVLGFCL